MLNLIALKWRQNILKVCLIPRWRFQNILKVCSSPRWGFQNILLNRKEFY
jgi:hypothetical protein